MSTTPVFAAAWVFPQAFCGMGDGSGLGFAYVDNLDLATVMAFAWSTETIVISTTGSAGNGTSTVSAINTLTVTGTGPTATAYDRGGGGGMWNPGASVNTAWASWPSNRIPRERVCAPPLVSSLLGNILSILGNASGSGSPPETFFSLWFYVGPDPVNSDKYRIYYGLEFTFGTRSSPTDEVSISFSASNLGGSVSSGTITVSGITFSWYAYLSGTGVPVLITTPDMTASSAAYTYI